MLNQSVQQLTEASNAEEYRPRGSNRQQLIEWLEMGCSINELANIYGIKPKTMWMRVASLRRRVTETLNTLNLATWGNVLCL